MAEFAIDQKTIEQLVMQAVQDNILSAVENMAQDPLWLTKIEQLIRQLSTPALGNAFGLLPNFFGFIYKNLLGPIIAIDREGNIGPEELKRASESLSSITTILTSMNAMMRTFQDQFGQIKPF